MTALYLLISSGGDTITLRQFGFEISVFY